MRSDTPHDIRSSVETYYGEELCESGDLRTSACATSAAPPPRLAALIDKLHPETRARYFGCGLIAPEKLNGAHVLDLGCGAGRDVYVISQLVGETGRVVGVDMTEKQLEVAARWRDWHREKFGHQTSNVSFQRGYLEDLDALDLPAGGFDVAVSNCVVNLATDKQAVLAGVRRLLKPGGEFYFADVYADRSLPAAAKADPVLYGECLGGALVWSEFVALAQKVGFAAPRLVAAAPIETYGDKIKAAIGETKFVSATVRLFATPEAAAGESATLTYEGGAASLDEIEDAAFAFDLATRFEKETATPTDAATARLIEASRFGALFESVPSGVPVSAPPQPDPFEITAGVTTQKGNGCCG